MKSQRMNPSVKRPTRGHQLGLGDVSGVTVVGVVRGDVSGGTTVVGDVVVVVVGDVVVVVRGDVVVVVRGDVSGGDSVVGDLSSPIFSLRSWVL
jgi:hypothetical protein